MKIGETLTRYIRIHFLVFESIVPYTLSIENTANFIVFETVCIQNIVDFVPVSWRWINSSDSFFKTLVCKRWLYKNFF